jgi:hypothetical protein
LVAGAACTGADEGPIVPCPEPSEPGAEQVMVSLNWQTGASEFLVADEGIYWARFEDSTSLLEFLAFDQCDVAQTLLELPGGSGRLAPGEKHIYWAHTTIGDDDSSIVAIERGGGEVTTYECPFADCELNAVAEAGGRLFWRSADAAGEILTDGSFDTLYEDHMSCTRPRLASDGELAFAHVGASDECKILRLNDQIVVGESYFVYDLDANDDYVYWTTPYGLYEGSKSGTPEPRFLDFYPQEPRSFTSDDRWLYATSFAYGRGANLVAIPREGSGSMRLVEGVSAQLPDDNCWRCTSSIRAHGGYVYYWKRQGEKQVLYRRAAPD